MNLHAVHMAKIHVAKTQLGMDDESYRALLARVAGVQSAKELSGRQVGRVLAEFQRLGWTPVPAKKAGRKSPNVTAARKSLMGKIKAQLTEAERPWSYADAMALRMFKVERVEWCDAGQLHRLVAALVYDAKRHGRTA